MHSQVLGIVFAVILLSSVTAFVPSGTRSLARLVSTRNVQHLSSQSINRKSNRLTVTCAWNSEVVWSPKTIISTEKCAENLYAITIDGGDTAGDYTTPGQYLQIKIGDNKPGFYALASAPSKSDSKFEFLVKEVESNTWFTKAKEGDKIEMSGIMGKGFPIVEEFEGYKYDFPVQNIVLCATGTGIAAIRAAIESGMLETNTSGAFGRSCTLFYGAHSPDFMAYKDKLKEWEERGITVVPVMSSPESSWGGRKGFVQHALKEDGVRVPRNTGALIVGQKEMIADVKGILSGAGVFPGRQLLNF